MTVNPLVKSWSEHFNFPESTLVQAICTQEGNILKAVQCSSSGTTTESDAIHILCRSIVHALYDYVKLHAPDDFVAFLGARWAPVGVANDPHGLNVNWVPNVRKLWGVGGSGSGQKA